jgi:heme/copper-type cytochrome/quinol oxidase subunit 2
LLPKFVLASPNNTLLNEMKRTYPLTDPINFSSEFSREFFYQNTNFTKFILLKDFLRFNNEFLGSSLNLTGLNNYLFFYLFSTDHGTKNNKNLELYKNQYRPMRKGVSNMIRLHATGAVAMPIEIRLHILASSKDVIHSWAIPSAGIKIDCVPGYSSHRVTIFLVSGIFWGQCMEVCGRFHHWMPIIVYFMKRDLFFL